MKKLVSAGQVLIVNPPARPPTSRDYKRHDPFPRNPGTEPWFRIEPTDHGAFVLAFSCAILAGDDYEYFPDAFATEAGAQALLDRYFADFLGLGAGKCTGENWNYGIRALMTHKMTGVEFEIWRHAN